MVTFVVSKPHLSPFCLQITADTEQKWEIFSLKASLTSSAKCVLFFCSSKRNFTQVHDPKIKVKKRGQWINRAAYVDACLWE